MKIFKLTEFYMNVILIAAFAISFLISGKGDLLFIAYFTVGAVQLFSMIIHAVNHWFTGRKSFRLYYHWLVFVLLLLVPVGGIGLFILLYAAPFLAMFYTYICWRELQYVKLKEFVHLK
jgi:hypothetical protein